jgi:hypothetical protein
MMHVFKKKLYLEINKNISFYFFIFNINISKLSENTKKIPIQIFQGKYIFKIRSNTI